MSAVAALLPDGRLHLQHGPIDCLCRVWGEPAEVHAAYAQAARFFGTVLDELCTELGLLRSALPAPVPRGAVARRMHDACSPFAHGFITPMAAVAGAVADAVLAAMVAGRAIDRGFVNNGGDIAFHLAPATSLRCGLVSELDNPAIDGTFLLAAAAPSRGLATSGRACKGRGGRSFSFGIADSVSVLARTAAMADAAATVIGNALDLPGHAAVDRRPACDIDPASDLGDRLVTYDLGAITGQEINAALAAGEAMADTLVREGLIHAAVMTLRGAIRVRSTICLQEAA